jgi:hypothetical protein
VASSYLPAITAIRECCLGAIGSVRTVAPGTVAAGAYPSTVEHEAARALALPRFEVTIERVSGSPDSPWTNSPQILEAVTVKIRSEWSTPHELLHEERDALRAEALDMLKDTKAALMRSPNILTTSAAAPTGIVSGCMHRFVDHAIEREDWPRRRFSYVSRYQTQILIDQTPG